MNRLTQSPRRRPAASRPQLETLEDRRVPTVLNYGGNLMPHVEAQSLFLGNAWAAGGTNASQTATLNSFLADVTTGAYMDALTRAGYGVGRGSATSGAVDTTALAANTMLS